MRSQIVKTRSSSSVEICPANSRSNTNENRSKRTPKTSGKITKQVKPKTSAKYLLAPRAIHTFKQYFLRSTVKENKDKKYAEDILRLPFRERVLGKGTIPIDYIKSQSKNTKINKKYKLVGKSAIGNVTRSTMCSLKQS